MNTTVVLMRAGQYSAKHFEALVTTEMLREIRRNGEAPVRLLMDFQEERGAVGTVTNIRLSDDGLALLGDVTIDDKHFAAAWMANYLDVAAGKYLGAKLTAVALVERRMEPQGPR